MFHSKARPPSCYDSKDTTNKTYVGAQMWEAIYRPIDLEVNCTKKLKSCCWLSSVVCSMDWTYVMLRLLCQRGAFYS